MRTSLKFPLIALSVVSLLSLGVRAQSSKPLRITTDTKNSVQHIEKIIFGALNNQGIMIPETTVSVTSKDGKVTVDGSLNTDITVNVGKDLTMSSLIGGWLNTLLEAKWSSLIGGKMNQMRSQFNTLWGGVNNTLTGETIYGVMIAGEGNQLSGGQSVLLGGSGNRLEGEINTLINANHTQLRGQNNLLLGVHNANISGEHLFVWGNLDSLEADRLMFLGGKLAIKTPTPHQDAMITLSGDLRIAENINKNNEITNTPEYSGAIKTVSKEGFFCSCSFDGEKWNPMIKDSLLCQVLCAGEENRSRRPKPGECGQAQGKNFNNLGEILPDQACQMGIVAELNQQGNSYHWKCEGINRGPSASCTACAPAGEWNPLTKLCDTRAPKPGECGPAQGKSFNNLGEILPEQACKSGTMEALNKLETQYEWNCKGEYGGASVTCHACTAETVWNPATKSCDTRQYGLEICRHKGDLSAFLLQRRWKPSEACETLPQKYTKDQPLNLQTPKLTGHTFYGRSTDPSCQGTKWSSSSPFVREENTKLYACRHPNTYQIHYDKQGGQRSSAPDTTSKQVTYGEIIGELRRDIVKENHTFTDWYDHTNGTSGTGKVYQTNQRYTVPGDSTAYAAWTPNLPTPQNPQSAGTGRLQLYLCDPEGNYVFTEKTKPAGTKEEINATQYQLTIYLDPQGGELPKDKRKIIFYKPLRGWEVSGGGTVSNQSDNAIAYTYATGEVGIIKERCYKNEQSRSLPTPTKVCAEFQGWFSPSNNKLVEKKYVVSPTEYAKKEIYLRAQRGNQTFGVIEYYLNEKGRGEKDRNQGKGEKNSDSEITDGSNREVSIDIPKKPRIIDHPKYPIIIDHPKYPKFDNENNHGKDERFGEKLWEDKYETSNKDIELIDFSLGEYQKREQDIKEKYAINPEYHFMGRYNNPMLKGKPIESFEANTCETKQFWGKRGTGEKFPPDTIPNRFPDLSCENHPDLNISGIIIKACNEGATRLGDPGTGFISQNYLNACPPGYHLPTLAEWRSLFAVAGGRIGFQNAYIHWDKISLGKKYFAKIIYGIPAMSGAYLNGTSATSGFYLNDKPGMSGLYLHHPGIYRSSEATGSIEIIGTEIKNPWFHSKSIDFRTGMVRCFKDCQGVCNKKVIPAYQDKCAGIKCQYLTSWQRKNLAQRSEEELVTALCPWEQGLTGWSVVTSGGEIVSWKCHGECGGQSRTLDCGEKPKTCQIPTCPDLTLSQKEALIGKTGDEMMKVLCPNGTGAGLTDWSAKLDQEGMPVAWKCQGECEEQVRKIDCGSGETCEDASCPDLQEITREFQSYFSGSQQTGYGTFSGLQQTGWRKKPWHKAKPDRVHKIPTGLILNDERKYRNLTTLLPGGGGPKLPDGWEGEDTLGLKICGKVMKPGQSLKCWSIEYDSSGKIISFSCQRDKGCDGENPEIACGGKKCREGKCPQLSYRQQSLLAGKSKEEMIRVLCPKASETGLTGWSIRLDENKKPVSWKCQGECDNKPRNISCGEKDCPEPKCPELTQEQRAMLAGLSPEHIGRVLCPGVPGNNFAPRINQGRDIRSPEWLLGIRIILDRKYKLTSWEAFLDENGVPLQWNCQGTCKNGDPRSVNCGGLLCTPPSCNKNMSKKEREGLAGASTGQMLKVLCPGAITAGLTDWSIRLDEKGVPIAWKCQGECYNGTKRDTQDCFPTPKCPSLSPEYLESLKGKGQEEMIKILCPEIAQLGMEERSITLNGDGVPVAWQCKGSYQDNPLNLQCGKNTCKGSQCSLVTTVISKGLSGTSTSETMAQLCPGGTKNGLNDLTVIFNKKGYPAKWTCKGDCGNSPRENTCSNWSMPTCPTLTTDQRDQIQRKPNASENSNILCPNGDETGLTEIGMKTKNDKPIEWRCKGTDPEGNERKIPCSFPASPAPTPTCSPRECGYDYDQEWSEWGDWRKMEEEQRELKIKKYLCPGGGDITDWSVTLNAEGKPISWTCNSICNGEKSKLTCKKPECECPLPTCKQLTKADEEKVLEVHKQIASPSSGIDLETIEQEAKSALCQAISPAKVTKATRELTGDEKKTLESWTCTQTCTSQGKKIVTTVECPGGKIKGNEGNDCLLWRQYLLNRIQSILGRLLTLENEIGKREAENIEKVKNSMSGSKTEEVIPRIKEWLHEDLLQKLRKISPKSQDLEDLIKQLENWDGTLKEGCDSWKWKQEKCTATGTSLTGTITATANSSSENKTGEQIIWQADAARSTKEITYQHAWSVQKGKGLSIHPIIHAGNHRGEALTKMGLSYPDHDETLSGKHLTPKTITRKRCYNQAIQYESLASGNTSVGGSYPAPKKSGEVLSGTYGVPTNPYPEGQNTSENPCYKGFIRYSLLPLADFSPDPKHPFLSKQSVGSPRDRNCLGFTEEVNYQERRDGASVPICEGYACSQAMFPRIRYINGSGRSPAASAMTNPTYNPVGFGVGYCGYAACDYDCAEGYHWDPQATGNVFQEAKNQRGNCIYNYRFCEKLRTGGLVWTAATAANPTITYLARHLQPELWPDQDYSITGNLAQRWIAGRWEPARANTIPHIYAGDPQEPCTFDCQDPLNTHRDAVLGRCIPNIRYCDTGALPENAVWNTGGDNNPDGKLMRVREGTSRQGRRNISSDTYPPYRYTNTGSNIGNNACTFRCRDEHLWSGYHWDGKACVPNAELCPELPSKAIWYQGVPNLSGKKIARHRSLTGQGRIPGDASLTYYTDYQGYSGLSVEDLRGGYCLFDCETDYHEEGKSCKYSWKECDKLPFTEGIEFVKKQTDIKVRYKQMRTGTGRGVVHPTVHESHTDKHGGNTNCVYKCVSGSHRSGNDCKPNKIECDDKEMSNTSWCRGSGTQNGGERYKMLWNDSGVLQSGPYNPVISVDCSEQDNKCSYRCSSGYHRSGGTTTTGECVPNKEDCSPDKPRDTLWCWGPDTQNGGERYKRLWNDTGEDIGSGLQETKLSWNCDPQGSKCSYRCLSGSHRSGNSNNGECVKNSEKCTAKPDDKNTQWCRGTGDRYRNLWDDEGNLIGTGGDGTTTGVQETELSWNCSATGSKCSYRCLTGYHRSGNSNNGECVKNSEKCTAKPDDGKTQWCRGTGDRYRNLWDDEGKLIGPIGDETTGLQETKLSWNCSATGSKCSYRCPPEYHRSGGDNVCMENTKACQGLPSNNAEWCKKEEKERYSKKWSVTGSLIEGPYSTSFSPVCADLKNRCAYKCISGYHRNGRDCVENREDCTAKPDDKNTQWCQGTGDRYRNLWDDEGNLIGTGGNGETGLQETKLSWNCDPQGSKCSYRCRTGSHRNGYACVLNKADCGTKPSNADWCKDESERWEQKWNDDGSTWGDYNSTEYTCQCNANSSRCAYTCPSGQHLEGKLGDNSRKCRPNQTKCDDKRGGDATKRCQGDEGKRLKEKWNPNPYSPTCRTKGIGEPRATEYTNSCPTRELNPCLYTCKDSNKILVDNTCKCKKNHYETSNGKCNPEPTCGLGATFSPNDPNAFPIGPRNSPEIKYTGDNIYVIGTNGCQMAIKNRNQGRTSPIDEPRLNVNLNIDPNNWSDRRNNTYNEIRLWGPGGRNTCPNGYYFPSINHWNTLFGLLGKSNWENNTGINSRLMEQLRLPGGEVNAEQGEMRTKIVYLGLLNIEIVKDDEAFLRNSRPFIKYFSNGGSSSTSIRCFKDLTQS